MVSREKSIRNITENYDREELGLYPALKIKYSFLNLSKNTNKSITYKLQHSLKNGNLEEFNIFLEKCIDVTMS